MVRTMDEGWRKVAMPQAARFAMSGPGRTAFRGFARIAGAVAWAGAAIIATVLALFFAATVVVIAVMAAVLAALAGMAISARRSVRTPSDPDLIEAHNVGGHSWVA